MASTKSDVRLIGNTEFYGGLSTDDKIGIENSYADGVCLDVRKSPSQMSVLPQAREFTDAGVITGLITAMCQTKDGTIWGLDEYGKIYSIDSEYHINKINTPALSTGHGLVYSQQKDALVFTDGDAGIYTYGQIINPRNNARKVTQFSDMDDFSEYIVNSITKNYNGDYISNPSIPRNDSGTYGNTTENIPVYHGVSCPTTIVEEDWAKALFLPGISPIIKIGAMIASTGNATIKAVVHDSNNNVVAESAEVSYSSITAGEYYYFTVLPNPSGIESEGNQFETTPWSGATLEAGGEYHVHFVASTTGVALQTVSPATNVSPALSSYTINNNVATHTFSGGKLIINPSSMNGGIYMSKSSNRSVCPEMYSTSGTVSFTVTSSDDGKIRVGPQNTHSIVSLKAGVPKRISTVVGDNTFTLYLSNSAVTSLTVEDFEVTTDASLYYGARIAAKGKVLAYVFNGKHPIAIGEKIYIGNGRYLAEMGSAPYDMLTDTDYIPNRLRLDDGYEVCSIATTDEYVVIGAEKFSNDASRGFQDGKIYFWDGTADNPNFYIECPMGSPHAMFNYQNILYIIINGALYAYTGGKELIKVRTMRGTDTEYSGENTIHDVYPNMMAVRREIMMVGFPSYTTSTKTRFGIHGWGSIDKNFPNCFTYNYKVPGATAGQYNTADQQLRIGCVYNFGDTLLYGYEVTTTTHPEGAEPVTTIDPSLAIIDNSSSAANDFYWESLVYDAGSPILEKSALRIGVYFNALPTGATITPIYRIDDGSVDFPGVQSVTIAGKKWYKGVTTATAGMKEVTCEVAGLGTQRVHEFQCGFIGTTANGTMTPPVIKQVVAEIKLNNKEAKI